MKTPLLLIDIGNSRFKWATVDDASPLAPRGEFDTASVTANFVEKLAIEFSRYKVVLSSVVPKLVPYFKEAFKDRLHHVTADSPHLGILFKYPNPQEIGADRLTAAAAVRAETTGPAIVVQCGTATAFNVLDAEGMFCGGVIAPGPYAQLASLVGATAQLPDVQLHPQIRSLGTSTKEAIRLGVVLNYQGGVNAILQHLCRESKPPLTSIILTGGNTHFLTDSLDFPFTLRPLLVFEGLRIIGLRAFKDV